MQVATEWGLDCVIVKGPAFYQVTAFPSEIMETAFDDEEPAIFDDADQPDFSTEEETDEWSIFIVRGPDSGERDILEASVLFGEKHRFDSVTSST